MQITGDVQIAAAFVKARQEIGGTVTKDTKGARGKYASLAAITDATAEVMGKHGLALVQECFADEASVTVYTTLIHESGSTMEFAPLSLPVEKRDAQGVGSAITYARRYQLSAVCGLAPEDDDGVAATQAPGSGRTSAGSINTGNGPCKVCRAPVGKLHASSCTATEAPTPVKPASKPTEAPPSIESLDEVEELPFDEKSDAEREWDELSSVEPGQPSSAGAVAKMNAKALQRFNILGRELYPDNWDDKRPEIVGAFTKKRTTSSKELTADEASALIEMLEKRTNKLAAESQAVPA